MELNKNISDLIDKEPEDPVKEFVKEYFSTLAFALTLLGIGALIGTGIEAICKWMWGY